MRQIRILLYFLILWILYNGLIGRYIVNNEILQLVPDLIIIYLLATKRHLCKKKIQNYIGKPIQIAAKTFLFIGIISSFIYFNNILSLLWGIRIIVRFAAFAWLIFQFFQQSDVQIVKRILYKSFNICVIFCIIQEKQGESGDFMGGIFSGNGQLCMFACIMTFIFTGDFLQKRMKITSYILRIACMFIFAILGEIKLLYFIIPICFYGMYVLINKFSIYHVVILFFIYWGFVPIMEKAMSLYYDKEYVNQVFTKEYIEDQTTNNYGFADGGFNRSTALSLTSTVILKTPLKLCIGNGIGSGSASNIFGGSIYHAYQYTTYNYFATSYILVETGWIGFILFCLIFLILLYRFYYYYKHYDDIVIKYWASCGIMGAFITYPLMWYSNCPYYDYYLFYILWALCFLSISYRLAYLKNKEK